MLKVLFKKRKDFNVWKYNYFKENNLISFNIGKVYFVKNKYYLDYEKKFNFKNKKNYEVFINKNFKYNPEILDISFKYKIPNYEMASFVYWLSQNGFKFGIKKIHDLSETIYYISIFKYNDLLLSSEIYLDYFNLNEFSKIIKGELIMSEKKEKYIINFITKELKKYDLTLENYDYIIKEIGENVYEISLEHLNTNKSILIKNIQLNEQNEIISIGQNNGFVL